MLCVKTWFLVLALYLVAVCTLLSPGAKTSELSFLSDIDKRGVDGPAYRVGNLGVSGSELLRLFRKHLVQVVARTDGDEPVRVSPYYDSLREYLFQGDEDAACSPHRSAVAKLTSNVNPIPVHSHNDYWRSLPLFEAIANGASSVEADVWIVPDVERAGEKALAVAHSRAYVDPVHRTLDSLYTTPLLRMLDQVNCGEAGDANGVFFDSPETTLFLFIDFKSPDSGLIYQLLMEKYLKPLIDKGYLTHFDMQQGKLVWRQITVVLTGDFPNDLGIIDRDVGLGYLGDGKRYVTLESSIVDQSSTIRNTSVMAASSFSQMLERCGSSEIKVVWRGRLARSEIQCLRSMIKSTQEAGIRTRIWGLPNWPLRTVKTLWSQVIEDLHSDVLNVDDLHLASRRF
ncbi:hypothetical protein HG536_0D00390 [Torulaspora globosa]|uniref:Altered inheritance of mitochondria protein 6 n=1 Tax=Torulaspora globosa TaxID=48254 RepID=A0A7G3ZG81_9SACH|nr:uncharacterized protein HG536_0D00390 [Torulaspora globosa]QLL32517.1 hypothetical protein HG536_0D00390 [Torulaspora globosa]